MALTSLSRFAPSGKLALMLVDAPLGPATPLLRLVPRPVLVLLSHPATRAISVAFEPPSAPWMPPSTPPELDPDPPPELELDPPLLELDPELDPLLELELEPLPEPELEEPELAPELLELAPELDDPDEPDPAPDEPDPELAAGPPSPTASPPPPSVPKPRLPLLGEQAVAKRPVASNKLAASRACRIIRASRSVQSPART